MSLNGLGQFIVNSTGNPVVPATTISTTWANALTADIATALSTAVYKDGQQTMTANIPMGGFKLTGVGAATVTGDALAWGRANGAGGLVGTTTNDSATAGYLGEYPSSDIPIGSSVSLTTTVAVNMTSLALAAGDWDVRLQGMFINIAATATLYDYSLSLVSATIDTTLGRFGQLPLTVAGNGNSISIGIVPCRFSLASPATIYAVARSTFSAGAVSAFGTLSARRVR